MDIRTKKFLVGQNIGACRYGQLKSLPLFLSLKNYYNSNFTLSEPTSFCDVYVKPMHSLLIAKEFANQNMNPVIVTTVTSEFTDTNITASEGMHDDIINIRTNFNRTLNAPNLYPIKGPMVVYAPCLTTIRDETGNYNPQYMFKSGLMVASPLQDPVLTNNCMNLNDYFITKEIVETVFQTAILRNHDVLILTDFGCKHTKNPVKDIADIYNMCILKYGHMFKYIVIAINIMEQSDMAFYAYFSKEIIKPQDLAVNIDNIGITDINQTIDGEMTQQEDPVNMLSSLNSMLAQSNAH